MELTELIGKKFERLTVIKRTYPNSKDGHKMYLCRCDCGKEKIIRGRSLKNGDTKSCGCLRLINLTGKKFGRLTVIKRVYPNTKDRNVMWLCKCSCGKEKIINGNSLRRGDTKSCGCLQKEIIGDSRRLSFGLASMHATIEQYKKRAKIRGLKFKLTEEQFIKIIKKDCYYCGAKPNNVAKQKECNGNYIYNGIDRIDNNKGYTLDNVVPCCKICNYAKRNLTIQEFEEWIKRVNNNIPFGTR